MARTKATARAYYGQNRGSFNFFIFAAFFDVKDKREQSFCIDHVITNILENVPKNFSLITSQGTVYLVNKTIIYYSSKTIRNLIDGDSTLNSYTVKIDSDSIVKKFASILNGHCEAFQKEEKKMTKQFAQELLIEGFPAWLRDSKNTNQMNRPVSIKNTGYYPLSISIESFSSFISSETINPLNVTIQTKSNSYKVPLFGAFASATFADFYKSLDHPKTEEIIFKYDIDDPNNAFEEISNLLTGGEMSLFSQNISLLLQISKDLRMPKLTSFIETSIKEFEQRKELYNNIKHYLNPTDELISKFLSMKPPTSSSSESVFQYIVSSGWLEDYDHIYMLSTIIHYISLFNLKILDKIIDIIESIDKLKTENKELKYFIRQLVELVFSCQMNKYSSYTISSFYVVFGMIKRKLLDPAQIVWIYQSASLANQYFLQNPTQSRHTPRRFRRSVHSYSNEDSMFTSDDFFISNYFNQTQYLFYPEFKSIFKTFFDYDLKIDEDFRSLEGSEGSLKRLIYDDNVDGLKEYIKNHPSFKFSQNLFLPNKNRFTEVSILEFAAMVESPKVFDYIFSQSQIIQETDTAEPTKIIERPDLLTPAVIAQSMGKPEISIKIRPYLKAFPNPRSPRNQFNISDLISSSIYRRDLESFKILTENLPASNFFGYIGDAIVSYNSEILEYIINNIVFISIFHIPFLYSHYTNLFTRTLDNTDYFKVLIELFGDNIIKKKNQLHRNQYDQSSFAIPYGCTTGIVKILHQKYQEKQVEYPISTVITNAATDANLGPIKYLVETLNYKLTPAEIPNIIFSLLDVYPPIGQFVYEHADISDDNIIHFIEIAALHTDIEFISMLIQKQLKINPKSKFDRAFHNAISTGNMEMIDLIENIKVENDESYKPIADMTEVDYLTTVTVLLRKTIGYDKDGNSKTECIKNDELFITTQKAIELLKRYLHYFQGYHLENAIKRILIESIALSNSEIALFALSYNIVIPHAFVMACSNNLIDVVKKCVEINNDPSFYNYSDRIGTGLYIACKQGNESIVDFLLTLPDIQIRPGPSPIVAAAFSRNYHIFSKLIKKFELNEDELNQALLSYIKATNEGLIYPPPSTPEYCDLTQNANPYQSTKIQIASSLSNNGISTKELTLEFPGILIYRDGGSNFTDGPSLLDLLATPNQEDKEEFLSFFFNKNDKYNCESDFDKAALDKYRNMINYRFYYKNETFLIAAANMGRIEIVRLLLQNPETDVNQYDHNGNTALMHAVFNNHMDIVRLLCELRPNEIDVNHENFFKRTALTFASYNNRYDIIEYLLKQKSFDLNKSHIETAVAASIMASNRKIVETLLDPSKYDFDINRLVYMSHPPFSYFQYDKKSNENQTFRRYALSYNSQQEGDESELNYSMLSLLYICYSSDDLESLKLLSTHPRFDKQAARIEVDKILRMPLTDTILLNELLKISEIDINYSFKGRSLLFNSILNSQNQMTQNGICNYILDSPDFDPVKSNINDCFFVALRMGNLEILKKLTKYDGINYNGRCPPTVSDDLFQNRGMYPKVAHDLTPLSFAVNGMYDIFIFLLSIPQIDVNARNADGTTAIFSATNMPQVLNALMNHKNIDLNIQDDQGKTFLMQFISHRAPLNVLSMAFAKKEIDLSITDNEGRNVVQYLDSKFTGNPKSVTYDDLMEMYQQKCRNNWED